MSELIKAILLELNQVKASKKNLAVLFLSPALLVAVIALTGSARLPTEQAVLLEENARFFDFYAAPLLATLIFFITSQTTALRIVGERKPFGTLDRDLLAIPRAKMFLGKFLANALIALTQCLITTFFALTVFNAFNRGSPVTLTIILFLTALVGLSTGLFVSVFSSTKEEAMQFIPLIVFAFLVLSGLIIQFNQMPEWMKTIAVNTPLALSSTALSQVMLGGATLSATASKTIALINWVIALLLLGATKFWLENKVKIN